MFKSTARATLVAAVVLISGTIVDVSFDDGFAISKAQAMIGRPLTPLSYAGVARPPIRQLW